MSKKTDWTDAERRERIAARAERKQHMAAVQNLRDWRQKKASAAAKAAKKRAKKLREQPRGIDRVPERLRDLAPSVEPVLVGKRRDTPLARAEDMHAAGNYATRRARGQRGKQRPLRRREMPGAAVRRIERNRKAWSA